MAGRTLFIVFVAALAVHVHAAIVMLSPQEESFILSADFIVSFQYRDRPEVRSVRLYVDGVNVSHFLKKSGTTYAYIPDSAGAAISPGPHILTIALYRPVLTLVERRSVKFYVAPSESISVETRHAMLQMGRQLKGVEPPELVAAGRIYAAVEYRQVQDKREWTATIDAQGGGHSRAFASSYNLSLNTAESPHYQTLQRYQVAASWKDFMHLRIGDTWPITNEYLVADQRVRGIEASARTPRREVNFDIAYGESRRAIRPYRRAGLLVLDGDSLMSADSLDSAGVLNDGCYRRSVLVSRLHFGGGKPFKAGIGLMKATDDRLSLGEAKPDSGSVSLKDSLSFRAGGPVDPAQNLVIAADMASAVWKERVRLYGGWAFSLFTRDISNGPLRKDTIENRLGAKTPMSGLPESLKDWYIINETTTPLPFSYDSTLSAQGGALLRSMAWHAGAALTARWKTWRQNINMRYFSTGPNFVTFGNLNLPVNCAGYEIVEELLHASGRFGIRGSFRDGRDLFSVVKPATAHRMSYGASISAILPGGLPALSVNYQGGNGTRAAGETSVSSLRDFQSVMGLTANYMARWSAAISTFTLSYANTYFESSSPGKLHPSIDFTLRQFGNSFCLAAYNALASVPIDNKLSLGATLARGDFGLAQWYGSGGVIWHVAGGKLDVSSDFGFKQTNDFSFDATNEITLQAATLWNIAAHSSLQWRSGLEFALEAHEAVPTFLLAYERRF